jgi:hypothetical protein
MKEPPVPAHALDIDLQLRAIFRDALPTDFSFGHGEKYLLIARMDAN